MVCNDSKAETHHQLSSLLYFDASYTDVQTSMLLFLTPVSDYHLFGLIDTENEVV